MHDRNPQSSQPESPLYDEDEVNDQGESEHTQQLEDLQKLLEKAHINEAEALDRAKKSEEKLTAVMQELSKERKEKNEAIEKLTIERDVSADVAKSLQKSNQQLQTAYGSLVEETNNNVKRYKKAIKNQHDLLEEKDMQIAVLEQALDFNGIPLYSKSKITLFQEPSQHEPPSSSAGNVKYKRG